MKTKDLGNKMIMSENIKRHLNSMGLNVKDFSEIMDFKYTTVLDWVNAKTYPRIDKIELMARYFGVDKSDLVEEYSEDSTTLSEINKTSAMLEEPRQESVLKFANVQLDRQNFDNSKLVNMKHFTREKRKPKYTAVETIERVSAGFGFHYGENEKEIYYTLRTDLPKFDFATVVVGDSMEPLLHDGDVILIRQSYDVPQGGIYVVDYDETSWVKEVTLEDDVLILHSINEIYRDRFLPVPAEDGEYWNIIGEVVDWFTPEMV